MTAQTNDIDNVCDNFVNSLGSGVSAAKHLHAMITSVVTSRDTTVLARAIQRAEGKGDKNASGLVRFVIGQIWPEAKLKANKGKAPTITISGIEADPAAIARFATAIEKKLSLRHSTFRKTVKGEATKPEFDPAKRAERLVKAHKPSEITALIAALQAQLKKSVS